VNDATPAARRPLLTPLLLWFMLAMILANIAGGMVNLLMPVYLTELGASVGQVGLVFTLTSVVILVLQIFGGWVSDSIGRLKAIAIGSIGGVVSFIAMLLAPSWQWMLLAMSMNQLPYALVGPSFGAFIAENSDESNRGRVYGVTDTLYQVTGIIGPPLGGLLAGRLGFRWLIFAALLFYTGAAGLRIWMATTMRPPGEREARPLTLANFRTSARSIFGLILGGGVITWIFITDGVRDTAFRLTGELQPIYLRDVAGISLEQIGLLGGIFSLSMMFTPLLSGRISDRYGERVPISAGFLLIFAALAIFLQVLSFPGFVIVWVLFGTGVGLLSPAYQSLISKVVPQSLLGIFNGLFYSSLGFISLPAPWIGAQLWERFTPKFPFYITAFVALFTILPTWLKFKLPDKTPAEATPSPLT
jgi:MFS family permease